MKEEDDFLDQKAASAIGTQGKEPMKNILSNVVMNGMSIVQAIGFPPGLLEMIYSYALELYQSQKYQDANAMFFFLTAMNSKDPRFVLGCAASFHKLKRYLEASSYYILAASLEPENPTHYFHAADCFLQLGELPAANVLLEKAIAYSEGKPEYEKVHKQATALKEIVLQNIAAKEAHVGQEESVN